MLKALELSGFKSFADRTRFEFPNGICVVVGPNGSGKSNVVDAVKWVLGSQSAKSLRGKEMTDVIFNGCPTRTPMGTGEVTLTLDNSEGRLAIDAKEVHVSRRVYRSGEGEYLLNRQPCRLKDIRELLAATGITTEAYCIIEQGKVDALLQSSPRDRRVIFEEAAGISQFKAKKAIAMRRMERVEQNLLRLSDIVDEVESRLRSIRSQAGKARRYRECVERLKQLRTEVALVDWRQFTRQIDSRQKQFAEVKQRSDEHTARLERAEAEVQELEKQLEAGNQRVREIELKAAGVREQIAALVATIESQTSRRADLEQEVAQIREQLTALDSAAEGTSQDGFQEISQQVEAARADLANVVRECESRTGKVGDASAVVQQARSELELRRGRLSESQRKIADLEGQIESVARETENAQEQLASLQQELTDLVPQREALAAQLAGDQLLENKLTAEVEQQKQVLAAAERRLVEVRRELTRADVQHRRTEAQLTRVRERIAVLSELESRLEGLDGGVQDILRKAQEDTTQFGEVHGVVADLFHVDVDSAPLIEVALGERAQYIVVTSVGPMFEFLHEQPLKVAGRVGFLGLQSRFQPTALDNVDLSAEPGVMGRADRFVESAADYQVLARRLLGRTWLVDRLATAMRLTQSIGRGLEFVTSDGEMISADGTLVIGPRQAATGVLSRRSELRSCHEQASELEQQLKVLAETHSQLDQERVRQEELVAATVASYTTAASQLTECHRRTAATAAQLARVVEVQHRLEDEYKSAELQIADGNGQKIAFAQDIEHERTIVAQLSIAIQESEKLLVELEEREAQVQRELTGLKIAVAKCEQRLEMLHQQWEQLQRGRQEREQMLAQTRERLASRELQIGEVDAAMAAGQQALADLNVVKEQHTAQVAKVLAGDEEARRLRQSLAGRLRGERQQSVALQTQLHKLEVTITRLHHERQTLCERMQDDYGIDLGGTGDGEQRTGSQEHGAGSIEPGAEKSAASSEEAGVARTETTRLDRDSVEREIAQLRNQINNIGAINLEALDELEQLEARFEKLSGQYQDLIDAKAALERITQRINTDSKQLFLSTIDTVRGHFKELFRRLFGGGEADIVVDEAEDVLESGIEIVARPPGKEACSISLLSGGEKTLTCVALLLAVFRSKPSPFCILDEVDAALDEANIGRFTAVLREFLSFTQFIVITHSKKTMSGADTLYGVTMEESGVSKRVSVRFEDVSEDGHILPSAMFHAREMEVKAAAVAASIEEAEQKRAA